MNTLFRSLMVFASLALAGFQISRADDAAPATGAAVEKAPAGSADSKPATAGDGEKSRFKQHDGLWWYWLPSNSWVYWTDGKWVPYDPESYAKFQASRVPRGYSYSSGGTQQGGYPQQGGFWGPVRYNQYGQPQYPYSQRKSGIRQLGPVPAMGGVRSLPGWGGER